MKPSHSEFSRGMKSQSGDSSAEIGVFKNIDYLSVKHKRSVKEMILGFPTQAKYEIYNRENQQVFSAQEESTCCQRFWCTPARRFTLNVFDSSKQEIIRIHREFKCCAGCCWFAYCENCRQEVTIEAPPGNVIGTITQGGSCWRMHYIARDADQTTALNILGPCCICDGPYSCCCENKFTIFGTDQTTEIGAIHKKYAGCCNESFSSADHFTCEVPMNLDSKMKAIILGALFVIDYTNYSMTPQQTS